MIKILGIRALFILVPVVSGLMLAGCGDKTPQPPYKPPVPKTTEGGDKLMQEQRDALEKAKGVGQIVEKADAEKKEAIQGLDQGSK